VLVSAAQTPEQLCVPVGHCPEQAALEAMHEPAHTFMPEGQAGTHAVPSQLTVPPAGARHGAQEFVPQLITSWLLTQLPLQE
jgi:hypothetical protein